MFGYRFGIKDLFGYVPAIKVKIKSFSLLEIFKAFSVNVTGPATSVR